MTTDYTHISIILDRSGSMETIRDDTIGGFNSFLRDQQAEPGTATLTLVQFDSQDANEVVHQFRALSSVPPLDAQTFVPRGGTPLLDAMGRGINDIEQQIAKLAIEARPAKVMVVIITDGCENASHEFDKAQVETMIKDKQKRLGWQFLFLSADLSSLTLARSMGIGRRDSASFSADRGSVRGSWDYASSTSSDYRRRPSELRASDETTNENTPQ